MIKFATLMLLLVFLAGCAPFQKAAGKVLTSTALTVDAGMTAWADHVNRDHVSASQQEPVRKAYGQYQLAMQAAVDAYAAAVASGVASGDKSAWAQASAALQASATGLLALIHSFGGAQ